MHYCLNINIELNSQFIETTIFVVRTMKQYHFHIHFIQLNISSQIVFMIIEFGFQLLKIPIFDEIFE